MNTSLMLKIFYKLTLSILIIFLIGLPIVSFLNFLFFSLSIIIIFSNNVKNTNLYLVLLVILFISLKFIIIKPEIEEGHNVVILNDNSSNFYKDNLPNEIFNYFFNEFKKIKSESKCIFHRFL